MCKNSKFRGLAIVAAAGLLLAVPAAVSAHAGLDELKRAADAAVLQDPQDPQVHLQRARVLELTAEWTAALAELDVATARGANPDEVGATRAAILLDAGRPDAALAELDRVLARRPDAYGLVFERGRALVATGRREEGARELGRAIASMPAPRPEHVFARRDVLLSLGRRAEAIAALDEGMARVGRVASLQLAAIDLELALDRPDGALRRLDELIGSQGRNPAWIARRGEILQRAGRPLEARAEYTRALALIESHPAARRVSAFDALRQRLETALGSVPQGEGTTMRRALALAAILAIAPHIAAAAVITRGPYLQMPTASTIIVRWRTDVATTSRVAYGPAPGSLTTTVDDGSSTTEHIVAVNGLTDDTLYYYSAGEIGVPLAGDDAFHYFRTAPAPGTARPMRFWSIGDAGFTGANLDAVRDAYGAYAGTSAADLFLLLGDDAYLLGTDAQFQAALFDEHALMLQRTPVWSVFGNHEALSSNSALQTGPYFDIFSFPTAGEAGGVASGTEAYYSFDYGNVHVIVLDSEQAPTSPSTPMLTWLQADLQAAVMNAPGWIIALWHRPPYSKGLLHNSDAETQEINMRQYAVPLLESYGVDLVLSGHSHSYERSYLIDNHYGLSSTFSSANQVEPGDGDPLGDGAYRKESLGPDPHAGAVYVVNGSGSEVRNTTLNHPAMVTGLLELGSLVIDVDGNTLTARFLNSAVQVRDTFRIVKGTQCPALAASGCTSALKGKLSIRDGSDPAGDKWLWKWRDGTINPADVGNPADQTDVAVCVYDANGLVTGGEILHGAPEWAAIGGGLRYRDVARSRHGIHTVKVKTNHGRILATARGAGTGVGPLAVTLPVRAQLVNLDTGACWESVFATARTNNAHRVIATLP